MLFFLFIEQQGKKLHPCGGIRTLIITLIASKPVGRVFIDVDFFCANYRLFK